jgi:hypothetical protein
MGFVDVACVRRFFQPKVSATKVLTGGNLLNPAVRLYMPHQPSLSAQSPIGDRRGISMATATYVYRGLQVCPLVYPRRATRSGYAHNYDDGFDAAVRINEIEAAESEVRSRVFRLPAERPFSNSGDARRASIAFAEHLIDGCPSGQTIWDRE